MLRRVLVVDDEHLIADTFVAILNQAGFESTAVYSGADAVREAFRWRPDLVISDVGMPDVNGVDASIQIQKALPACKIFLFSGQFESAELLHQAKASGYDFELLAKPIDPQDLLNKLL
jgi:CheY-like chemotaxis protein